MTHAYDRREFMKTVGLGTAMLSAGYAPSARGFYANEKINVGCIGTGGRARMIMEPMANIPGTRIAAVCDIWDENLEKGRELADPKAVIEKDYRRILDRKDIDAVLIGTPDHWHAALTIAACEAGKDVYVEKPLTHSFEEGAAVVNAQNKYKRIVQVGTQQRSMPQYQKACEIVQSGQLGDIHKVHLSWNRNQARHVIRKLNIDPKTVDWKMFVGSAPAQPFNEYKFRNWRWFWDFGGGIFTDLMVHKIDIANWFLGLDHPSMATSIGDQFISEGVWETPDTVQTLMKYPDKKVEVYFEGTFCNTRNRAMIEIMGSEGTLYVDRGRYEVIPEPKSKLEASEWVIGEGELGSDYYDEPNGELLHATNWLDCVRSRKTPNCPAEVGVQGANAAHLANRALRSGKVETWEAMTS